MLKGDYGKELKQLKLLIEKNDLLGMLEGLDRGDYRFADMTDNGHSVTVYLDTYNEKAEQSPEPCETFDLVKLNGANCLESILQKNFGCKKPLLKNRKVSSVWSDGSKSYTVLTVKGSEAYNRLIDTLYALEEIGVIDDANDIIENLDSIASGGEY